MRKPQFRVRQEQHETMSLLRVCGEVDCATAPSLQESLGAAFSRAASVAFDLSSVPFMDSAGAQVLLRAHRMAAERGGSVYIVGATRPVMTVCSFLKLDQVFTFCREEELPSTGSSRAGGKPR